MDGTSSEPCCDLPWKAGRYPACRQSNWVRAGGDKPSPTVPQVESRGLGWPELLSREKQSQVGMMKIDQELLNKRWLSVGGRIVYLFILRRATPASPNSPLPNRARVPGSGLGETSALKSRVKSLASANVGSITTSGSTEADQLPEPPEGLKLEEPLAMTCTS